MRHVATKPVFGVFDQVRHKQAVQPQNKQAVQPQNVATGLTFWIQEVEELYYLCSESTNADQRHSYCTENHRLWFLHMQNAGFLMTQLICVFKGFD